MTRLPLLILPALSGCLTLDFVVLNASPLPEDHQFSLEWTHEDNTVTVPNELVEDPLTRQRPAELAVSQHHEETSQER